MVIMFPIYKLLIHHSFFILGVLKRNWKMKKTKKFYVKPKERQRNVLLRSGKKRQ